MCGELSRQALDKPQGRKPRALPVLLAWRTLDTVEQHGPGAKLTRGEVAQITGSLQNDLDHDRPAVRERPAGRI